MCYKGEFESHNFAYTNRRRFSRPPNSPYVRKRNPFFDDEIQDYINIPPGVKNTKH